jgi:hypothetical protein
MRNIHIFVSQYNYVMCASPLFVWVSLLISVSVCLSVCLSDLAVCLSV